MDLLAFFSRHFARQSSNHLPRHRCFQTFQLWHNHFCRPCPLPDAHPFLHFQCSAPSIYFLSQNLFPLGPYPPQLSRDLGSFFDFPIRPEKIFSLSAFPRRKALIWFLSFSRLSCTRKKSNTHIAFPPPALQQAALPPWQPPVPPPTSFYSIARVPPIPLFWVQGNIWDVPISCSQFFPLHSPPS